MIRSLRSTLPAMVLIAGCTGPTYPIPLGADTYYYGRINHGMKFDVALGTPTETASALLQRGFRYDRHFNCDAPMRELFACSAWDVYELYRVDEIARHGTVYLKVIDGHVAEIGWSFALAPLES